MTRKLRKWRDSQKTVDTSTTEQASESEGSVSKSQYGSNSSESEDPEEENSNEEKDATSTEGSSESDEGDGFSEDESIKNKKERNSTNRGGSRGKQGRSGGGNLGSIASAGKSKSPSSSAAVLSKSPGKNRALGEESIYRLSAKRRILVTSGALKNSADHTSSNTTGDVQSAPKVKEESSAKSEDYDSINASHDNSVCCLVCGDRGSLICCDECPSSYHQHCMAANLYLAPYLPTDAAFARQVEMEKLNTASTNSAESSTLESRRQRRLSKIINASTNTNDPEGAISTDDAHEGETNHNSKDAATHSRKDTTITVPQLDSTSTPSDNTTSSNDNASLSNVKKWKCPKCAGVRFAEGDPVNGINKRYRFNYQKWMETTFATANMQVLTDDSSSTENMTSILDKYALKLPTDDKSKKKKAKSIKLSLADVTDLERTFCVATLAEEAVLRGVSHLREMCDTASQSRIDGEQDWFADYGCEVAWLLSNLIDFCDSSAVATRNACLKHGRKILSVWYATCRRRHLFAIDHLLTDCAAVLCLLEAVEADSALQGVDYPRRVETLALLTEVLEKFDISQFIGFKLNGPFIEVENVCPNCNVKLTGHKSLCNACGFHLARPNSNVQYRQIMDALVWSSLFHRLGLELPYSVGEVLATARRCRPWRLPHAIGLENYRLQVYLLTHVVFVLTCWGKYRLDSRSMRDDFVFLREALREAVSLDDPELAGETLQVR